LAFALTFIIPVLLLQLTTTIIISVIYGLSVLGVVSFYMAKRQKVESWKVILEHLVIVLIVIIITHYLGDWIGSVFK